MFLTWALVVPVLVFRSGWAVVLFLFGSLTLGVVLVAAHYRFLRTLGGGGGARPSPGRPVLRSERPPGVPTSALPRSARLPG